MATFLMVLEQLPLLRPLEPANSDISHGLKQPPPHGLQNQPMATLLMGFSNIPLTGRPGGANGDISHGRLSSHPLSLASRTSQWRHFSYGLSSHPLTGLTDQPMATFLMF
jgi:hypothetical protein